MQFNAGVASGSIFYPESTGGVGFVRIHCGIAPKTALAIEHTLLGRLQHDLKDE